MSRISVAKDELPLGIPLPWALYDQDGHALMQEGAVLESEEQLHTLLASSPLRELSWDSSTAGAAPEDVRLEAEGFEAALAAPPEGGLTFEDMGLRVGDRIQLQLPPAVSQERHIVKLVGYLDKVSLLVTAPLAHGLRLPLQENDKVVARIFSSQKAFGFSSTVERVCKSPFEYLHLSFPDQIQGSVIRKSPRVRTRIIASIAKPDAAEGGDRQSGVIVNLSADGALVKARQPLFGNGQRIQLSFRVSLHQVDAYLTVNAIIRSTFHDEENDDGEATLFGHGVQFQDLHSNDSVILQSLIYQQMIEQPRSLV